jgi:tRNA(Arg) A34 adenosine deaminase TadA
MGVKKSAIKPRVSSRLLGDEERMAELVAFTARSLKTLRPVPFGSSIVHTRSGEVLLRTVNAVARELDPSCHAEVRAIRLATKRLKNISLSGRSGSGGVWCNH